VLLTCIAYVTPPSLPLPYISLPLPSFLPPHFQTTSCCTNAKTSSFNHYPKTAKMKENYTQLYPNAEVAKAVADYCVENSTPLPKHVLDHHAWGVESQERSNFMVSPLQCQWLIWVARALGVKRGLFYFISSLSYYKNEKNERDCRGLRLMFEVLEIGTFIGFSTMGWVEAVGPDGHVTALEFDAGYAAIAEDTLAKNGIKNVDVVIGDARESIKKLAEGLEEPYDLIFVDADKTSYVTYLELVLEFSKAGSGTRLLRKGGVILADNVLTRGEFEMSLGRLKEDETQSETLILIGLVAESSTANPNYRMAETKEGKERLEVLDQFNKEMAMSERIDVFLMPLFDGLGMGRLVD